MFGYEDYKKKKINNILSVVKVSSLLFSGAVFYGDFYNVIDKYNNWGFFYFATASTSILTLVFIFSLIYTVWAFSINKHSKKKRFKYLDFIENIIFVLIFLFVIIISGAYASQYKFLFLLIIITSTIQSGMNQGIIIAAISTVINLTIDIVSLPGQVVNHYFQNDIILSGIFFLIAWPLGYYVKSEKEHIESLKRLANEDGLTGIFNHRYFQEILKRTIMNCEKGNKPVSLIFIDIDYFKHYNDLYGHQKGDEVLKKIGTLLKECIRESDVAARYGGEEFAIILPNTEEEDAVLIAEKIRVHIQDTYFEGEENQPNGKITASIGISTYPDKAKNDIDLLKSADDALYRAKFFNKNKTETYTSVLDELKKDINEDDIEIATSIKTLISVINVKDRYTYGHVERVVIYCRLLADKLQICEEEKKNLIYGAYMHDIGKINISKDILNKRMPLTSEEWELLKQHPANGVEIIKPVESLKAVASMIMHHHERYDGKGYPENLKGEEIPYLARVLTVADSFDAMTSNRPYNKRKTYEEAMEELKRCSGTQFDPDIAKVFIEIIAENNKKLDEISMA